MTQESGRLSITLEILTPMFLGGVDGKKQAELRPASVRGALRVWWRAWHQARSPSATPDELFVSEMDRCLPQWRLARAELARKPLAHDEWAY
jgi:CRISPR/Cas system CMR-associated protein Cmr1 (group 7 of RAMP superfamily)